MKIVLGALLWLSFIVPLNGQNLKGAFGLEFGTSRKSVETILSKKGLIFLNEENRGATYANGIFNDVAFDRLTFRMSALSRLCTIGFYFDVNEADREKSLNDFLTFQNEVDAKYPNIAGKEASEGENIALGDEREVTWQFPGIRWIFLSTDSKNKEVSLTFQDKSVKFGDDAKSQNTKDF